MTTKESTLINPDGSQKIPGHILPVIVVSQFAGTSLWFAGNAVIRHLMIDMSLPEGSMGYLVSSVQFGFITGTLLFAVMMLSDRISPSRLFLVCSFLAAAANASILFVPGQLVYLLMSRFLTGFFLAGIYPVGMKIASDWHQKGLGKALGYLVGALVLGTAFPHFLNTFTVDFPWMAVIIFTSLIAIGGGILLFFLVPDGPYRKPASKFDPSVIATVFSHTPFRKAAFGYFGHMWELYTFWAFVPVILTTFATRGRVEYDSGLFSFMLIAIGSLGCVAGGYIALRAGSKNTALAALIISGLCCLVSPFLYDMPFALFITVLVVWGIAVITDSPQFSTLVARNAPSEYTGSALTIVNSIGFAISIVSIEVVNYLIIPFSTDYVFVMLALGPLFGVVSLAGKG
ncbi:MAG: MFS transporter [Cyclobacteriaceae bacterium]|nr:MFS transporter [Cyclobacteriaceae bacterium]